MSRGLEKCQDDDCIFIVLFSVQMYTCHSVKVTGGPASSPPLDLLNLFSFHFGMGVPIGRSIFELQPEYYAAAGPRYCRRPPSLRTFLF